MGLNQIFFGTPCRPISDDSHGECSKPKFKQIKITKISREQLLQVLKQVKRQQQLEAEQESEDDEFDMLERASTRDEQRQAIQKIT